MTKFEIIKSLLIIGSSIVGFLIVILTMRYEDKKSAAEHKRVKNKFNKDWAEDKQRRLDQYTIKR